MPRPSRSRMVSPSLAGQLNRGRVLKTLYANGPLPRPELARHTGSTRATIGQIVQPLLDEGLLVEGEPIASGTQGGKPARPIWFAEDGWPVGALLLLPTGARAALVSAAGTVRASETVKLRRGNHDQVIHELIELLREVTGGTPLKGIGIAVGGMVDTETGEIVRFELAPGLNGLPVGRLVGQALGAPAFVDNDSRAHVLGDLLFGAGRAEDSFASVYIGEGIGAGFILDGALHRGARGAGGEVGHTAVDRNGELCRCGLRGCWETIATTRWLRAQAAARGLPGARTMTSGRLVRRTDASSQELLQEYARNIGVGLANLQQTLGPGFFVVHGDPVSGGELLRELIEKATVERSFVHPGGLPRVLFASPDDYAALRGAAAIVLSRTLNVAF